MLDPDQQEGKLLPCAHASDFHLVFGKATQRMRDQTALECLESPYLFGLFCEPKAWKFYIQDDDILDLWWQLFAQPGTSSKTIRWPNNSVVERIWNRSFSDTRLVAVCTAHPLHRLTPRTCVTGSLTSRKSKGPTRKGEGRLKWGNENRGQLPYSFK